MIVLIVGDLYVSFLSELKSKNICINKDYWILGSSQIGLCGFQGSMVGWKRVPCLIVSIFPGSWLLPWLLACWSLVDVVLCLGLWDLLVSLTFSCRQKFVCNVPMGWNTGSTPFLVLQEPSVLLSSTTLMSLPFGKHPSLLPAFFVICPFMMKSLFPLCVTLTLLQSFMLPHGSLVVQVPRFGK